MGRVKEEPRGTLEVLQDYVAGSASAILDQADSLRTEVQRRIVEVGRGGEGQVSDLVSGIEGRLSQQMDAVLSGLSISMRRELDRVRERLRAVESRLADVPREGVRELISPLQTIASGAAEHVATALALGEQLASRLQVVERQLSEMTREAARESSEGDARSHFARIEQRLTDLGREVGTRLETRVVDTSNEQIARAGESAGLRDRLARLEGRLSDLSKEQLARAVETAALREKLFRLEQRASVRSFEEPIPAEVVVEE